MWTAILVTLLGTWLMVVPAVFELSGAYRTSLEIVAPLVVTFGAIAISQVTRPVRWVNVALGIWLAVAPWLLGAAFLPALHDALVAVAIILLSLVRGKDRWKQGGGWSSLRRSASSPSARAAAH